MDITIHVEIHTDTSIDTDIHIYIEIYITGTMDADTVVDIFFNHTKNTMQRMK